MRISNGDFEETAVPAEDPVWDYLSVVKNQLSGHQRDVAVFRQLLIDGDTRLKQRFADEESVEILVRDRARLVDVLLRTAWQLHVSDKYKELALIAVGGYGRGELNLCS